MKRHFGRDGNVEGRKDEKAFCRAYLRTMDPERSAELTGCRDGFALLESAGVQSRLEKMREDAAGQIRREDAIRRLAQLAFGRANDAVKLALRPMETDVDALDLSAVTEIKVTDKGGVEVKLADRVRALETLCELLSCGSGQNADDLYRALAEGLDEEGRWENG